jgi:CheY-like chemotaxis protein
MDVLVKLIDAFTKLASTLVWPAIVTFIVIYFRGDFRDLLSSLSEFTFKAGGFEASVKRKQVEAAAALAAAVATRPEEGSTAETVAEQTKAAVGLVADSVTPRSIRKASRSTVLWVDDRPNNNIHERQALGALGIGFVISTSTDDALEKISRQSFDAIISDMGRPPDPRAGYTLLDKLRSAGDETPFIIYAGSRAIEHQAEARRRGAIGCTNRPNELFEMVLAALGIAE